MVECTRLLPWKRLDVQHIRIEGCGRCSTANGWWCSLTCTDNIWRAYGVYWHCPQNIANAIRDYLTRKKSHETRFREAAVKHEYTWSCTLHRVWFVTFPDSKACWTCKVLPLHIASHANHHIETGFGRTDGDGSLVSGGIMDKLVLLTSCLCEMQFW